MKIGFKVKSQSILHMNLKKILELTHNKGTYLLIIIGIGLASIQFLFNRSLWLDEASLSLNIVTRDNMELLMPLERNQMAPILFLQIVKFFTILVPNSELGLRLFPFVAFLLSIFFIYRICKMFFEENVLIILSLSLFLFNSTVIYYSSEIKQYMSDLLFVLILYFFLLKKYKKLANKQKNLILIGIVGLFLSNIAPIVLFCTGLYLIIEKAGTIQLSRSNLFLFASWLLGFAVYYFYFIVDHPSRQWMVDWWQANGAFYPVAAELKIQAAFLISKLDMMFVNLFKFTVLGRFLFPTFATLGIYHIITKRDKRLLILFCLPIIIHIILSAFKLYPYDLRLILYTVPLLIILFTFGFKELLYIFSRLIVPMFRNSLTYIIPLMLLLIFLRNGYPLEKQEVRSCIDYVKTKNDSSRIFVHFYALLPFQYYDFIGYHDLYQRITVIEGDHSIRKDFISEIENLEFAGDWWFLFSIHSLAVQNYLDSLGCEKLDKFTTTGASAILYRFENDSIE